MWTMDLDGAFTLTGLMLMLRNQSTSMGEGVMLVLRKLVSLDDYLRLRQAAAIARLSNTRSSSLWLGGRPGRRR